MFRALFLGSVGGDRVAFGRDGPPLDSHDAITGSSSPLNAPVLKVNLYVEDIHCHPHPRDIRCRWWNGSDGTVVKFKELIPKH